MSLTLSGPSSPVNAGYLSFSPDAKSNPSTPGKRHLEESPEKENLSNQSPSGDSLSSPSPAKAVKNKFYQSPSSKSETSAGSPGSDPFNSPTTGSAGKKFGTISLQTPPAPAALASSAPKSRKACNLSEDFAREAGLFAMENDETLEREIPRLKKYQRCLTTILTIRQIEKIRFSQNSINNQTLNGERLGKLTMELRKSGWGKGKAPINIVEMPDGTFTSLDNRRLYCVRKVLEKNAAFELPVNIYRYSDIEESESYSSGIARDLANAPRKADLEVLTSQQKFQVSTWGYCVYMRMRVLSQQLPADTAYGYTELPTVRK